MAEEFKVGYYVTWNSEAGHVSGTIIQVHTKNVDYKGYTRTSRNTRSKAARQTMWRCTKVSA